MSAKASNKSEAVDDAPSTRSPPSPAGIFSGLSICLVAHFTANLAGTPDDFALRNAFSNFRRFRWFDSGMTQRPKPSAKIVEVFP
jgi:hypothetical protein